MTNQTSRVADEPKLSTSGPWWRWIGSVLAIIVLGWSLFLVANLIATHTVEVDRSIPAADLESLELRVRSGDVEIVGVEGDSISLRGSLRSGLFKVDQSESVHGGTLVIDSRCPVLPGTGTCSVRYRIEVPESLNIRVEASNTSLTLRDLAGSVNARTSNSAIRAESLSGDSVLRTSNDSIEAFAMAGHSTKLVTSNDHVTAEFAKAPQLVSIRTSNDSVSLLLPNTPEAYATETSTSNGNKTIGVRTDPSSHRLIQVRTSNDDLSVGYSNN